MYVVNDPLNELDIFGLSGVLTIYSSGDGDGTSSSGGTSGHSWISFVSSDGKTTTYGTWGNNPNGLGNGLHENLELGRQADASRSMNIDDAQEANLMNLINKYAAMGSDAWSLFTPCSTFASNAWESGTGEYLSPYGPYSNPSTLKNSINEANKDKPCQ